MCSDEIASGRSEMQSENNHSEFVAEGNFVHSDEIGGEKEENGESGDLLSLRENKQDELVKKGNFVHFRKIGKGNFMHLSEIRDEGEENEESGDLGNLCENNQNKLVKEGNFMLFDEIREEEDRNQESGDPWSLCEPAKSHGEFLLGYDGLSPVSITDPHGARRNLFSNNSLHFCTESLGFESSDERDDCNAVFSENLGKFMEGKVEIPDDGSVAAGKRQYAPSHGHMGAKRGATFPPPLTWMKSSLLLKPLRKDGRLLLREVEEEEDQAPRHESLHTWRQNGRLRLQLIPHKTLDFIDTSAEGDRSSGEVEVNGINVQLSLTSSLPSADESSFPRSPEEWGATWENECVELPRAAVSLPSFLVPLDRCQENTTCLSTWKPRCITI